MPIRSQLVFALIQPISQKYFLPTRTLYTIVKIAYKVTVRNH